MKWTIGLASLWLAASVVADEHGPLGDASGQWSYEIDAIEVVDIDGVRSVKVHADAPDISFRGTFVMHGVVAGAESGTSVWRAMGMFEGSFVTDTSPGLWIRVSPGVYRTLGLSNVSNGRQFYGDGVLNLDEKTWAGNLYEID